MSRQLPSQAGTVVIGAGAVGSSVAYHLSELGAEDVVVIDQGPLPVTGGSSVHAPGIIFQTSSSKLQTKTAHYTSRLLDGAGVYDEVGGIEVARSEQRMDFLQRRVEWGSSYGLPGPQLLEPAEVTEHLPLVDESEILGGYYSPTDGRVDGIAALEWYRDHSDAAFYGHTEVTDIETTGGAVTAVETSEGTIQCDRCVLATNNWGYGTGRLAGLDLPIAPVEHQYVVTEPLEELSGVDSGVGSNTTGLDVPGQRDVAEYMSEGPHRPVGRDQDHSLYFRTHGDAIGLGSYNHESLVVDPTEMGTNTEKRQASVRDFSRKHWEQPTHPDRDTSAKQAFDELLPATADAEYAATENGIFVFTPDGMPAIGETASVSGLWSALAIWWTHSGGYGKILAEWMENGVPRLPAGPVDTSGVHVRRFEPHAGSTDYFTDRGGLRYRQVYNIVEPRFQADDHRNLRVSPFYHRQEELGAEFYQSGGWETPQYYESNADLLDRYSEEIPETARLEGTFRAMDEKWRFRAHALFRQVVERTAEAHSATAEVEVREGYPALHNDEAAASLVQDAAREYVGPDRTVEADRWFAGEDFAYFLRECPGTFYQLGVGSEHGLHTAQFNPDEEALRTGAGFMAYLAWRYGRTHASTP